MKKITFAILMILMISLVGAAITLNAPINLFSTIDTSVSFNWTVDLNKPNPRHVFGPDTIGVHFFNGCDFCKNYIKRFDKDNFEIKSTIDGLIKKYIELL